MVVSPFEKHLRCKEARAKLSDAAEELRNKAAARGGRLLCADDIRAVPDEQPVMASVAIERWMQRVVGPPLPAADAAFFEGAEDAVSRGTTTASDVDEEEDERDGQLSDGVGEGHSRDFGVRHLNASRKRRETRRLAALQAECDELRRRRDERFASWFAAAALTPHWFPHLAPHVAAPLKRETEEIFRRVASTNGSSSSALINSPSISGSFGNQQCTRTSAHDADIAAGAAGAGPVSQAVSTACNAGDDESSSNDEASYALPAALHCAEPPPRPPSATSTVLAPVLVWLLSRAMTELYPGLPDGEAKAFARDDIQSATVDSVSFSSLLLVLIEPWCVDVDDAVTILREIVMENCLAPTYGHMPSGPGLSSSFRLPPVLASPSPSRNTSMHLAGNGSFSRASFAATRGSMTPQRVLSPSSGPMLTSPLQRGSTYVGGVGCGALRGNTTNATAAAGAGTSPGMSANEPPLLQPPLPTGAGKPRPAQPLAPLQRVAQGTARSAALQRRKK